MARRDKVWFKKRFHSTRRTGLTIPALPQSANDARIAGMWRVLLKNTPKAKLRRAGSPRIRRTFPRTGR
jgi:hypothetical protein